MYVLIIQKPVYAKMECEECYADIEIPYKEFAVGNDCIYDLEGHEIECPHCGAVNIIESIEFD